MITVDIHEQNAADSSGSDEEPFETKNDDSSEHDRARARPDPIETRIVDEGGRAFRAELISRIGWLESRLEGIARQNALLGQSIAALALIITGGSVPPDGGGEPVPHPHLKRVI